MLIETKSILAKLLATEDLKIEHRNVPTAAFDLKTRKIVLPNWGDINASLYDLLVGHEVSHALNTPQQGWHDAIVDDQRLKPFLNVVEDARIERKIKAMYPGLVKSFYEGYRELFNRDFFGVKDLDPNTLPLIDRINLHFKVGSFLNIQFTDAEQLLVDRCLKTETWEDVEALAQDIYGQATEDLEKDKESLSSNFSDEELEEIDEEDFGEMTSNFGEQDEESEEEETEEEGSTSGDAESSSEEEEEPQDNMASNNVRDAIRSDEPTSLTDEAFRQNEDKLVKKESEKHSYFDVPTMSNWKDHLITGKEIYGDIHKAFNFYADGWRQGTKMNNDDYGNDLYKEFLRTNTSHVNHMVQQFEMKRKAKVLSKIRMSKTGDLNENKLWAYKISEDLFKQSTMVPEGKNHGMLMYVDMSGSMHNHFAGTVDQLLIQIMFCRKVNIPYEVYGFTTADLWGAEGENVYANSPEIGEACLQTSDCKLRELFNSTWSASQTKMAMKHMLLLKQCFLNRKAYRDQKIWSEVATKHLDFSGTPLNSTIILGMQIAKEFRQKHKVQVLNSIFITDGSATDSLKYRIEDGSYPDYMNTGNVTARYKGIHITSKYNYYARTWAQQTACLLEIYKQYTGSRVVNFYLTHWNKNCVENEFNIYYRMNNPKATWTDFEDLWKDSRSKGMLVVNDVIGFDARILLKGGSALNIEETELEVKSNSKGDLLRGFRNFNKNKVQNKVFLNTFMDMVA